MGISPSGYEKPITCEAVRQNSNACRPMSVRPFNEIYLVKMGCVLFIS